MILFSLRCTAGHEIEAWFRDNATYERQHARGQIVCPDCGSTAVTKAPMAPRLAKSRGEPAPPPATPAPAQPVPPPTPTEFRRGLQEMRRYIETNCEHVGPRFAEEARKIHRGEAKARGIYGEATESESEALADDGIEVARIPWVPSSDA
ncbi:MAG TPA: DUF1178 family protein [Stellaceae bacterium]|jgi:hypothetical protein|nr:DUF1178 family protein [Stellaceae bacterium]